MFIVPENKIAGLLSLAESQSAVENVFRSMADRSAYNFPVIREAIGHADALYGFKSGFDRKGFALGVKAGGFWPHNMARDLTNHQSTVFLFDADTGRCRAAIGGNLLTALRTAAASAISIKYLAREDSRTLGIVGAGHQSSFQISAASRQRGFERVLGWNIQPEMLSRVEQAANDAGLLFEAVQLDELGARSDVIITITSSFSTILKLEQVKPGVHLACMGTDTSGKQEVQAEILAHATVFADEVSQATTIGECQHAIGRGLIDPEAITEIGKVINGTHAGRTSREEITLFDGTGVALQDLAVASAVLARAIEKGVAVEVDL